MNTELMTSPESAQEGARLDIHSALEGIGITGNAEKGYRLSSESADQPITTEQEFLLKMLTTISLGNDKVVGIARLENEDFPDASTLLPRGDSIAVRMDGHSILQSTAPRRVSPDSPDIRLGLIVITGPEDIITAYTVDLEHATNKIMVQKRTGQELITHEVDIDEAQHSGPPTTSETTHYSTPSDSELEALSLLVETVNDRKVLKRAYALVYDKIKAIGVRHIASGDTAIDFPNGGDGDGLYLAGITHLDEESREVVRYVIRRDRMGSPQITIDDRLASLEDTRAIETLVEHARRFSHPLPDALAA